MISLPFSERDFLYLIYGARLDAPGAPLKLQYQQDLYARWQAGERIIWNWAAFLAGFIGLGGVWLLYKRLYLFSFVYHLLSIFIFSLCIILFLKSSQENFKIAIVCINLCVAIMTGLFANTLLLTWLGAWREKFPRGNMRAGGDGSTVCAYLAIIVLSLSNAHGKFSSMLTVLLFGLFVFAHYIYYERELK